MRTLRQSRGRTAENIAVQWLVAHNWRVLARNVRVGPKDEIDVVALDPGPPPELVCVEVRSAFSDAFGAPEERIDRRKVAHLYRAARAFSRSPQAAQLEIGAVNVRVDLLVVDLRGSYPVFRHLKRLEPA